MELFKAVNYFCKSFTLVVWLSSKYAFGGLCTGCFMDTLLKTQLLVEVFLIQGYEYAALQKGLLIARFVEHFKIITLGKSQSLTDKFCQYFEEKCLKTHSQV